MQDTKYVEIIKNLIKKVVYQYSSRNYNNNFEDDLIQFLSVQSPESLQTLNLDINPELFLDTLLMEVRGATIKYSAEKKRNNKAKEQLLMSDIEILEKQLHNDPNMSEDLINEMNEKREALENIFKHEAEGAYIRSRVKYKLEGEKPSKMFCSLEKHNGIQRFVPQLFVEGQDGTEQIINEQGRVEKEIRNYYEDLFRNKDCVDSGSIESFLDESRVSMPKLSESQKEMMEGKISLDEMTKYLKKCKNNVAPGSSGFTLDFYKFFGEI